MANLSHIFIFLFWILAVSNAGIAKEFQTKQTKVYAEEGCGPNRYALFCRNAFYELTVANPNTEYVSSVKMKRLYDFLSHSKCYPHLKNFLCAALFPMCTEDPFEITFPCRDVCETAERQCRHVLAKYKEVWPEELNCTRFYDTDCLDMGEPQPKSSGRKAGRKNHQPDTGSGHKKHGHQNRNHHSRHAQPEPEPEPEEYNYDNYDYGDEVQTEAEAENQNQDNQNQVHQSGHAEQEPEEYNYDYEEEVHTDNNNNAPKKVTHVTDTKAFWDLFKKTLSDVSRSLKSLSDMI